MNPFYKNLTLWVVIVFMVILLYSIFNTQPIAETEKSYSEFIEMVDSGQVTGLELQGNEIKAKDNTGKNTQSMHRMILI